MITTQIRHKIKAFFACSYRLAVWNTNGVLINYYGNTKKEVLSETRKKALVEHLKCTWTLYKTGRFNLPEREIERSEK